MAKKFTTNTNAFGIAHYILLFIVVILCICTIAFIIIKRNNPNPQNNVQPTITHIKNNDPCVQRTINTIAQMWAYDPKKVPQKYWDIATNYLTEPITTRFYGICQDVAYTCHPGQIRRDCDPCAVPSARAYAMEIHTTDMIQANCPGAKYK